MAMILDYINKKSIDEWKPIMTKDELLERYWAKFLMYMYMEYTLLHETMPEFEKNLPWPKWSKENGLAMIEEFWETKLAMYLIAWYNRRWDTFNSELIVSVYDECIMQDMFNFLID